MRTESDRGSIFETMLAGRLSTAVLMATSTGVFRNLSSEWPRSAESLARDLSLDPSALEVLLGLLTRAGILHRQPQGYLLQPRTAAALDGPWGTMADLEGYTFENTETGREWCDALRGRRHASTTAWLYDPHVLARYPSSMRQAGGTLARHLIRLLRPWPRAARVLDLGGGPGTLGEPLLRLVEDSEWVVVDLPPLEPYAREVAMAQNAASRHRFIAADLREGLGAVDGYFDAIVLSQLLHLLTALQRQRLLAEAASRLAPEGRLAIVDFLVGHEPDAPLLPWYMALDWMRLGTHFIDTVDQLSEPLLRVGLRHQSTTALDERGVHAVIFVSG